MQQKAVVVCQEARGAAVGVRRQPGWWRGVEMSAGAEVKAGAGAAGDWEVARMGDRARAGAPAGDRKEVVGLWKVEVNGRG